MTLVLKIAAGVLLGILAAFALYVGFERWEMHILAKQRAEQERLETVREEARAAQQKARISKAAGGLLLFSADTVINRCGPPLRDDRRGAHGEMDYLGADGNRVRIIFYCTHDSCFWMSMERVGRTLYQYRHPTDYESFLSTEDGKKEEYHAGSPESQVKELPCVAGTE